MPNEPQEPPPPPQPGQVRAMFSAIAPAYDRLNHLLSLSVDRLWRRRAARRVLEPLPSAGAEPTAPLRILDVCAGTGDLALACAARMRSGGYIAAVDFSREMLREGRAKLLRKMGAPGASSAKNAEPRILSVEADALRLPFADGSFDAAMIAFGLRNLVDKPRGLREIARVVRQGGRVVVLEFSQPRAWWLRPLYRPYLRLLLPLAGNLLTRSDAYGYLSQTVREFASPEEVSEWMRRAGMADVRFEPLTGGIVVLHIGIVKG